MEKDNYAVFLNTLTPRVGPANAMNLMKDVQLGAYKDLFIKLGVSKEEIEEVINKHLKEIAQKVLSSVPVPSPFQIRK